MKKQTGSKSKDMGVSHSPWFYKLIHSHGIIKWDVIEGLFEIVVNITFQSIFRLEIY